MFQESRGIDFQIGHHLWFEKEECNSDQQKTNEWNEQKPEADAMMAFFFIFEAGEKFPDGISGAHLRYTGQQGTHLNKHSDDAVFGHGIHQRKQIECGKQAHGTACIINY